MKYTYQAHGACTQFIEFDLEDGIVHNVVFHGGCNGNLKAISMLVEGMPAEKLAAMFKGNLCGNKGTSCADQFSKALTAALEAQAKEA